MRTSKQILSYLALAGALALAPPAVTADAVLVDESFFVPGGVLKKKNDKKAGLSVKQDVTAPLRFDFSTLPAGTTANDIEQATLSAR